MADGTSPVVPAAFSEALTPAGINDLVIGEHSGQCLLSCEEWELISSVT
jgi:hypothetical protein